MMNLFRAIFIILLLLTAQKPLLFAQLNIKVNKFEMVFSAADSTNFKTEINNHKATINTLMYRGLEGQYFRLSQKPAGLSVRYKMGFIQYTIDDTPPAPISFTQWTDPFALNIDYLPDFYSEEDTLLKVHQLLGYSSRQALADSIFVANQNIIRRQSLADQRETYQWVLTDSVFMQCCPEYIDQAKAFMATDPLLKSTLASLNLEFIYLSTEIKVTYYADGQQREFIITIERPQH